MTPGKLPKKSEKKQVESAEKIHSRHFNWRLFLAISIFIETIRMHLSKFI